MANCELKTQVLIVGGGSGGVAAALGALAGGASVVLSESTLWIGGQLTSQFVPPDEHPWIETQGCTRRYRELRNGIRAWYRENRALTAAAKGDAHLNPGGGGVSKLCHEPKVSLAVMEGMLAAYKASGKLKVLLRHVPVGADVEGDWVRGVTLRDQESGIDVTVTADYVIDATELGDLLPLTKTEYVVGAESRKETGEPHALEGEPEPGNVQSFTWCFPIECDAAEGASHVIEKPKQYERWRAYVPKLTPAWPGKLIDWWYSHPQSLERRHCVLLESEVKAGDFCLFHYRKVVRGDIYEGARPNEVTSVNWPQNDYWEGNVIDQPAEVVGKYLEESRQLSLSLMYWLQTEAPRRDGRVGYRNLRLRPDLTGTEDGLAMAPYFRESRRIKAAFTVTENHVGAYARYQHENVDVRKLPPGVSAAAFGDTVGVGYYRIDLHPSTGRKNYIDIASLPFQIPLGTLIPRRVENVLAACKNIGTTHITNGCYRLHPVEWNIGEAAGALAAFCLSGKTSPRAVWRSPELLSDFQALLIKEGFQLEWKL